MRSAFLLSLFVAFLSRVYSDVVLTQAEQETAGTGATVRLVCKATGFSFDGFGMHWVRQVPGQGLEWLLYFYIPSIKYFAPGIQNRFTPSRDTSKSIFVVDIKNLKTEDTAVYYCARDQWGTVLQIASSLHKNPDPRANFDYWGGGTMLTVTAAAAAAPALYPLLSCEQHSPADSITFSCLAMDYLPVGISVSWKKDKETISTGLKTYPAVFNKKGTYTRSSQLTVSESEVGNSAIYCVVRHGDSVKEVKMPDRVVRHPTVSITVNSLEEIRRSRKVIAICSITEFWPKALTVSWLRNGQALDSGFVTAPSFNDNGNFSATSRLTLSAGEWLQDSIYTCKVTHKGVTQSQNISTSQDFSDCGEEIITIQPPPLEQVLLEATVTLTCVIYHVPYGATVTWSQGKTLLKSETAFQPGETPESVISNLSISTQDWLSGDEFHCVVSHEEMPTPERASISKGKDPHAQEPSVSVFFPTTEEASAQRSVTITCLVRGFSPRQIFVKWTVDGKLVNSSNYRNTEVVAETGNRSFFVYSLFTVGVEQWASGASFSCVVGHETLPMKTIARTVNRSSGKPSFVNVSLVLMDTVNSCQ